jgi:hypothetical protein
MSRFAAINAACVGALLVSAGASQAGITFTFTEVGGDVTMTSSGTFDTAGLPIVGPFGWGGTGIEENGNHDIMGGTNFGAIDISFAFNDGTDFSQWASANGPWTASDFGPSIDSGSKSFTTYVRDPNLGDIQVPGLGIIRADMNGDLWSPDQNWTWSGQTFASLNMIEGTYTVTDSVTGEYIRFVVVPAPGTAALACLGLGLASTRRRR